MVEGEGEEEVEEEKQTDEQRGWRGRKNYWSTHLEECTELYKVFINSGTFQWSNCMNDKCWIIHVISNFLDVSKKSGEK